MSLPMSMGVKLQRVIAEVNALGVRVDATESSILDILRDLQDIHARITALEEKVAQLTPCPGDPPDPEEPPDVPDPEPEPPAEPDLFLLSEPADPELDFAATEGSEPTPQFVTLYKSGTGTLEAPTVISTNDPSGIINKKVITELAAQQWSLLIGCTSKTPGTYIASVTVASTNQTNDPVVVDVSYVVSAAPIVVPPTSGETSYRGRNLPAGMTATVDLSNGVYSSLGTAFGGTVWDTADLVIGGSRYNNATTLTVSNTGSTGRDDLLAHLATVAANDLDYKIIVPVGTLSGGVYTLPAKTNPNRHCWIVLTTIHSGSFATPKGTKILASTTGMCILQGAAATVHDAIVEFADSANARGYSLHGIVVQNDQTSAAADIQLGLITCRRTTAQTALSGYPGRLYLDRTWVRGSDLTDNRRGVNMNGPYFHIEDSRITGIHCVGNESAGIGGWTGAQFHKHINLTIEAGTQHILYGGGDPDNPNSGLLDPADIYTERVYGFKPLTWLPTHPSYAGVHWTVKTGFEAKNVRRWLIDRCWTQNCWPDAQIGNIMLFQNLTDWNTNWLVNQVKDVIVRNHRFDYSAHGLNLVSRVAYDNPGEPGTAMLPTTPMTRPCFDNILATRIGGNRADAESIIRNGADGRLGDDIQLVGDINNLLLDRYTTDGNRGFNLEGSGGLATITNLVTRLGQYGAFRTGGLVGSAALAASFSAGLSMDGNVGYDASETSFGTGWDADETNASMLFQDYANYDYRLTTAHLTKGVAGSRPGCDIATLNTLLAGINT